MANSPLKILWESTAPWCPTGYGRVTGELVPRIKAKGYDISIFAYFGLKDATIGWQGIPVLPNNVQDYGQKMAPHYYYSTGSNCLISLRDIWIDNDHGKGVNWFPICPVDHEPMPPQVKMQMSSAVSPVAMSLFGKAMMEREGFNPLYMPHGFDKHIFFPNQDEGANFKKANKWDGKFVVGTVATNKAERKNYRAMIEGFAIFHQRHSDSVFYCHTDPVDHEGFNLQGLCHSLGVPNSVFFQRPDTEFPVEMLNAMYNAMDVFLLASKGEGFGIPIIEAQACGTPVIIPNYTSMKDLCGGGWHIREFEKEWTLQNSWWCNVSAETVAKYLEKAYYAKRDGTIASKKRDALEFSKQYEWDYVMDKHIVPSLEAMRPYCQETARFYRFNSPPRIAKVTLTNRCNAHCKSCLTPDIKGKRGSMSKGEFFSTMRLLADSGRVGYIMLSNIGEMFMIPDVADWVEEISPYVRSRGIQFAITTNGLLSKLPKGMDHFTISFNGYDKASYEDMTGLPYEAVIENIRNIVKVKNERKDPVNLQIHYCSFDGDEAHERMFAEQFADLNIPLRVSRKIENQFDKMGCQSAMADAQKAEPRVPCNYLGFINVHWNGDVIMCAHDFEGETVWGNLWKQGLNEILMRSNKALTTKQEEHIQGKFTGLCSNCQYNTDLGEKVYYVDTAKILEERKCLTATATN